MKWASFKRACERERRYLGVIICRRAPAPHSQPSIDHVLTSCTAAAALIIQFIAFAYSSPFSPSSPPASAAPVGFEASNGGCASLGSICSSKPLSRRIALLVSCEFPRAVSKSTEQNDNTTRLVGVRESLVRESMFGCYKRPGPGHTDCLMRHGTARKPSLTRRAS